MPPSKKATSKPSLTDPDLALIASLAEILNDTGLSEIELDRKGTKFRVAKQVTAVATVAAPAPAPVVHAHAAPAHEAPAAAARPWEGGGGLVLMERAFGSVLLTICEDRAGATSAARSLRCSRRE